jgi:putative transposase
MRPSTECSRRSSPRRHGKVGHLSQGRFKAIMVDRDAYLLQGKRATEAILTDLISLRA